MTTTLPSIKIKVHSFVDLITNSSSELYIMANAKTVTTMQKLVNDILIAGKSNYTAEQLFSIEIDKEEFENNYEKPYDEWVAEGNGEYKTVSITVKSLIPDEEASVAAANVLSNLTSMFEIDSSYEG